MVHLSADNLSLTFYRQKRGMPHGHNLLVTGTGDHIVTNLVSMRSDTTGQLRLFLDIFVFLGCLLDSFHSGQGCDLRQASIFQHQGVQVLQEVPQSLRQAHQDKPRQLLPYLDEEGAAPEDCGSTVTIVRSSLVFYVTTSDIFPYCPFLCMKFEARINVEKSNRVQNIKYLHKYCHKRPDQVEFV